MLFVSMVGQVDAATILSQVPAGMLCPGEEVTFSCSVTSTALRWLVVTSTLGMQQQATFLDDPQLDPGPNPTTFTVGGIVFTAHVTSRSPGAMASTLMVSVTNTLNGATVQCSDAEGGEEAVTIDIVGKYV